MYCFNIFNILFLVHLPYLNVIILIIIEFHLDIFTSEDTKTMEEDNSIDKPPSSPEDGEITEDEDYSLDTNNMSIEPDIPVR